MTNESKTILPLISLNGSGKKALIDQRREIKSALETALEAMRQARPHGRDYINTDDYRAARDAFEAKISAVQAIADEIYAEAIAINSL